ncbi:MAG: iron permease [Proteobacteria bacterium]|nr:iron permease [Pseudomonadota bacterium]
MFSSAIVVFREVLEAALIIGIIAAALVGVRHRGRWIACGVTLGVAGACLVAMFAGVIGEWAQGVGQELFNAAILMLAVLMLAWHNIWMARHGREMASRASRMGQAVQTGSEPVTVLLAVIGMAVLREGSEVVLFLYGIFAQGGTTLASMMGGALLGLLAGVLVGVGLYAGLLRIPLRWFFNVTAGLVLLLTAGMAGQAARFLIQAGWLPALADPLWDSSGLISADSALGTALHALAGYDAEPTGMHVLVYGATLGIVLVGMRLAAPRPYR